MASGDFRSQVPASHIYQVPAPSGYQGMVSKDKGQLPGTYTENPQRQKPQPLASYRGSTSPFAVTLAEMCKALLRRVSLIRPSGKGSTRPRVTCGRLLSSSESAVRGCPVHSGGLNGCWWKEGPGRGHDQYKPLLRSVPATWQGTKKQVSAMHFDERKEISLYLFIIYARYF